MLSFLKNHPFAVEAFFETSLVVTYALPKAQLQPLIPECLELDTLDDEWAFVAVAMVQTKDLRPKGFPRFLGNDFFLVGYRIFVRYRTNAGKRLRGLYILQSQTDRRKMEKLGNLFTHYNYTTIDIQQTKNGAQTTFRSGASDFRLIVDTESPDSPLPTGSPFADWKAARRFAGPLPFTFTYTPETREVLIIEGVRAHWQPQPVRLLEHHFGFFEQRKLPNAVPANAFIIRDIPYYWKKGKKERWNG